MITILKNKWKVILFCIIICIADLILVKTGLKTNSKLFNNIDLMGVIGLNVSVVVSVYLVQSLVSKRRRYDFMAKTFDSIIEDLGSSDLLNHKKKNEASLLQRYIANRLLYLSKAIPNNMKSDINYVIQCFERIQTYYGDHSDAPIDDMFYEREKINISTKIAKIQLNLYGFSVSE